MPASFVSWMLDMAGFSLPFFLTQSLCLHVQRLQTSQDVQTIDYSIRLLPICALPLQRIRSFATLLQTLHTSHRTYPYERPALWVADHEAQAVRRAAVVQQGGGQGGGAGEMHAYTYEL